MEETEKEKEKYPSDKYESKFAQMLYDHITMNGGSFESFECGVSRQTKFNWHDRIPEFRNAREMAERALLGQFERVGYAVAMGIEISQKDKDDKKTKLKPNPKMLQFFLSHRFNKIYSTKQNVEHSGEMKTNYSVNIKIRRPGDKKDEEKK